MPVRVVTGGAGNGDGGMTDQNQRVLDYVRDRLDKRTSPGQCILHLAPGGKIKSVEWQSIPINVADIINGEENHGTRSEGVAVHSHDGR